MKILLLINILVCLAQSQIPPRLQDHLLSMDLGFTPVDYNGNHPFERRRKLENEDYDTKELEYLDSGSYYESLRIKFMTDPIKGSATYNSLFEDTLQEVLDAVADTWSRHLFVYPVNGAIPISPDDCLGLLGDNNPSSSYDCGVDDADMVIYVGALEEVELADGTIITLCDPGKLAFAFTCSVDQFDRPVIGAINFCLSNIITRQLEEEGRKLIVLPQQVGDEGLPAAKILDGNDQKADVARVAIHEVAHALGFSFDLFKYFRDPETGEPLTPRPFVATDVDCVDGTTKNLEWPANNTIQTSLNWNGTIYHEVVTPRVRQVARNQFDCQNLTGARLTNRPEAYSNCTGSHWDERLFLSEIMGPFFSGYTDAVSPLTLALFEDSGWYKVSYEAAELSPFGKGRGCDFVNEMCIINDGVPEFGKDIFCNTPSSFLPDGGVNSSEIVCEPTHKSFAVCDLFDINEIPDEIAQLIPDDGVRYFSDTNLVSWKGIADFCPLPIIPAQLDCTNTLDSSGFQIYQGESRGLKSRCINGEFDNNVFPGCFEIECDAAQHKVLIAGQTCDYDGQLLSVSTLDFGQGTLVCPYLATICPELFCPGECSGRGVCDYKALPPRCNCFETIDTTAACSKDTPIPPITDPPTSGSDPPSSRHPS